MPDSPEARTSLLGPRRVRRLIRAVRAAAPLLACLTVALGSCATPGTSEGSQACFLVDNSQGGGTAGRVVVESETGLRFRLGEVSMSGTLQECIRQSNIAGSWRIQIESASSEAGSVARTSKRSEPFYIEPETEIRWDVRVDRLTVTRIGM